MLYEDSPPVDVTDGVAMILRWTLALYLSLAGLAAAPADVDPFQDAEPFLKYSFNTDDDRDYDDRPDNWSRRTGARFPDYVETSIDWAHGWSADGEAGGQSMRFSVSGAPAILYSPPTSIDAFHSYLFQGYVRTEGLENSAAIISISFLDDNRRRIQRYLTQPVTGTHIKWVQVRTSEMTPHPDARFVVIGCHLVEGRQIDVKGNVWFDELVLAQLPRMTLESNFQRQFVQRQATIKITTTLNGLDPSAKYRLQLELVDSGNAVIEHAEREVTFAPPPAPDGAKKSSTLTAANKVEEWNLGSKNYGFYRVRAVLERDQRALLERHASFAVLDLVERAETHGEFGWVVPYGSSSLDPEYLTEVATESGINWVKCPVWNSAHAEDAAPSANITRLFNLLVRRGINPVGQLSDAPPALRRQFRRDWGGVGDVFTQNHDFWGRWLDPVAARYASYVQYWQLGDDSDNSLTRTSSLPELLKTIKQDFDRVGSDTRIGVPWEWNTRFPDPENAKNAFISLSSDGSEKGTELAEKVKKAKQSGLAVWVMIKPLAASKHDPDARATDLVKRMVLAKLAGADVIMSTDVCDKEHGLLNPDGSPSFLFLPWRTTALALQGTEFLGSFELPGRASNYVFSRQGEVVMVAWNLEETTERLYLGENVTLYDSWGRRQTVETANDQTNEQILKLGPKPVIYRGCSEPIARFRLETKLSAGRIASQHGPQQFTIVGRNYFPLGVNGQISINVPRDWEIEPKQWSVQLGTNEEFKFPTLITLPPNVALGSKPISFDVEIMAERTYRFRIHRTVEVGFDDLIITVLERFQPNGYLEIEQTIVNNTNPVEILNLDCSLILRGHKRLTRNVVKLGNGQDHRYYFIPNGEQYRGKDVWLHIEQTDGRRNLNFRWKIGDNDASKLTESAAR